MSKRQTLPLLEGAREVILARAGWPEGTSTGELVQATGVTRQAVHYHIKKLLSAGLIKRYGAGRGTRYFSTVDFARAYPLDGLEEHEVWNEVRGALLRFTDLAPNVQSILAYGFTEMLNNAIEHSQGNEATVTAWIRIDPLGFQIVDDGIGAFRHVRETFHLDSEREAIELLARGKQTTARERHSGQGIFFTSKLVDRFELESSGLRWTVDNLIEDQTIGDAPTRRGTRVRCSLSRHAKQTTKQVFDAYSDPDTLGFDKSRVAIRLFESGVTFVSRSEAKHVAARLEDFREALIDFRGVSEVGQGFVDELFRVWAREHPDTKLTPVNMSPAVETMVRRGLIGG